MMDGRHGKKRKPASLTLPGVAAKRLVPVAAQWRWKEISGVSLTPSMMFWKASCSSRRRFGASVPPSLAHSCVGGASNATLASVPAFTRMSHVTLTCGTCSTQNSSE